MSLFGLQSSQAQPSGSFGSANPSQGGLFGSQAQQPSGSFFGSATQQNQQGGGIGQQQQQPQSQAQQTGSMFSALGSSTMQQPQQQGSLFPSLGSNARPQQPQQMGSTLMGQQLPQSQAPPPLTQSQSATPTIWTPGQGMTGVHRTVPMQMIIVKDKWDPANRASPFRAYTYNHVGEDAAPFYQPGPNDDETKWEDALRKRPGSTYVPVLMQGFWELGKRAQRQRDFLSMIQARLHNINGALTELLSRHDLKISVKIAACRRKHKVLSRRCLALAAKTQVLRNRGYSMDETEEELQKKLLQIERSVFDPSLNGRSEEIWARMLAIREHAKQLQQGLERMGKEGGDGTDTLDDAAMKMAKKILDDYAVQIEHLEKELGTIKKDFESLQISPTS